MSYHAHQLALSGLSVYRPLLSHPTTQSLHALLGALSKGDGDTAYIQYNQLFFQLTEDGFHGLGSFFSHQLRYTDNRYATQLENLGLATAAQKDIHTLIQLSTLPCAQLTQSIAELLHGESNNLAGTLPSWREEAPFTFETITEFYRSQGCGIFAQYRTFLWENGQLVPVANPDCPRPIELMGYSLQRNQVYDNTRSMMEGNRVNNVLLFGNGGTGKSATVKSMLYQEGFDNLRLIEIAKEGLENLSSLTRMLGKQPQKFILFIDDLAFDKDDKTYSSLKSILEGGLEPRPKNVAVYATSNRRHLVKQTISERAGDEMDTFETIAEKTALADRFGLRIPYLTMNKVEFLQLVSHLAGLKGIPMDTPTLHAQAMTWEIRHGGRTPRTAQQFISSLK